MVLSGIRNQFTEKGIDGILISRLENVRYLTGFTGSAGVVLITEEDAIFMSDFRYKDQAHEQISGYDIQITGQSTSLMDMIATMVKEKQVKKLGFEASVVTFDFYSQLQEKVEAELVPTKEVVETLRMIKTPEEITKLQKAAEIADKAFSHILEFIKPGVKEIDVANELEFVMRNLGATSNSSVIIVASGTRSALPHGVASDKVIESGDMVTLDFGALYEGYRSDLTRTIAVGEPPEKLKEIYPIVLDALLLATKNVKAGVSAKDADGFLRNYIHDHGYGEYFGHGGGHGIGLMIHEDPFLSPSSKQVLQAGMVITIEPGIYLPDIGGVRIEDDVLITEDGCEVLTTSPRELIIL